MGEILFLSREHKIHMFEPKYNALFMIARRLEFLEFLSFGLICKKLLEFFQVMLSSLHHVCIFLLLSERFYAGFSELNFSISRHLSTGVWQRLAGVQWPEMTSSVSSLVRIWKISIHQLKILIPRPPVFFRDKL